MLESERDCSFMLYTFQYFPIFLTISTYYFYNEKTINRKYVAEKKPLFFPSQRALLEA